VDGDDLRRQELDLVDNLRDDVDWRALARGHPDRRRVAIRPHTDLDVLGHHAGLEERGPHAEAVYEQRFYDIALTHRCLRLQLRVA